MAVTLNTNIAAIQAIRKLDDSITRFAVSSERLASGGLEVGGSGEDPAGLAIVLGLAKDKRMIQAAQRNAMEAVALVQKAENDLNSIQNIFVRVRELAVQSASDTTNDREREIFQIEIEQLKAEAGRIADASIYGATPLLAGGNSREFQFYVGRGPEGGDQTILFNTDRLNVGSALDRLNGIDLTDSDTSLFAIEELDAGMQELQEPRAYSAGVQFRLNSAIHQLETEEELTENRIASRERINVFQETTNYMKAILQRDVAASILAQANLQGGVVLKLLEPRNPFQS